MWVGGAGLMFALMLTVFFAWSRARQADGGLGWLESARRANFATRVQQAPVARARIGAAESVDDEEHLAAYNAYLARLNARTGDQDER